MPVGQSGWSYRYSGAEWAELQVPMEQSGWSSRSPWDRVGGVAGACGAEFVE